MKEEKKAIVLGADNAYMDKVETTIKSLCIHHYNLKFYKMRRNRMISGVLAGLSDKWNFDVTLVRFLFAIFTVILFTSTS
ncbi:PspC domain-containing protein [Streptococcus pneumoniae]|nr:PspC domain-containing protein [Streptococcus pneumoniae]